jgi:hypothetical protein
MMPAVHNRRVSEHGILMYDLAGNWCEECGRAKSFRLWPGVLTGCKTCDEVVTRHRCTKRPAVTDRAPGQEWDCPDCGGIWRLADEEDSCPDCCGDCGHKVLSRRWILAEEGDRLDTAPRHKPQPWTPFRNPFPRSALPADPPAPFGECYETPGGIKVHVRPGCRCKT